MSESFNGSVFDDQHDGKNKKEVNKISIIKISDKIGEDKPCNPGIDKPTIELKPEQENLSVLKLHNEQVYAQSD